MFSFGGSEFLIVVVLVLLLFGPDKIPQLARTIGRFMREFNKYKGIMESTLSAEIYRAEGPTKDSMTIEERIAKAGAASDVITADREAAFAEMVAQKPTDDEVATEVAVTEPRPVATLSADEADEEDEG